MISSKWTEVETATKNWGGGGQDLVSSPIFPPPFKHNATSGETFPT